LRVTAAKQPPEIEHRHHHNCARVNAQGEGNGDNALVVNYTEDSFDRTLTPGEALERLFLTNADRGANAANDELVEALRQRARAIRALAERPC
jgi:hypothetical protein